MKKTKLPLSRVYTLIEPGPVVLVTTADRGRPNVMTLAWHMMLDFEPPRIGMVLSERNHSFAALRKTKECVINLPSVALRKAVAGCGNTSGRDTDKFAAFGLTPRPAKRVAAPLIDECFASLECVVTDTRMVRQDNLFVLEVVQAWIDPACGQPKTLHHCGAENFMVAGRRITLPSKKK
ncbi:MAG: flavin reductase family protein [Kiritimatiellia bacterium]|jgi:flavin reductase (DIM6/NTAB) family NADH-FMN oxidoreductase RutF|nr:flavin reductase family protein [Kiritimatiellia bacterium]